MQADVKQTGVRFGGRPITLTAPSKVCLYDPESCAPTIRFLESIYDAAARRERRIIVDLSDVIHITAAAAVVLFANVTAAQIVTKYPPIATVLYPAQKEARRLMVECGLRAALQQGGEKKLDRLWKMPNRYLSGCEPDADRLRIIERIEHEIGVPLSDDVTRAIGEAVLNVAHHAYYGIEELDPTTAKLGRRWWQWYQPSQDRFGFVIYDRGVGIPRSFMHKALGKTDQYLVESAMTAGQSRHHGEGRGFGSEDLKLPVQCQSSTNLLVLSGEARYAYTPGGVQRAHNLGIKLSGTLFEWNAATTARDIVKE